MLYQVVVSSCCIKRSLDTPRLCHSSLRCVCDDHDHTSFMFNHVCLQLNGKYILRVGYEALVLLSNDETKAPVTYFKYQVYTTTKK
jgi:hypothetical protein